MTETTRTVDGYTVRYLDQWNELRQQLHPDGTPDGRTYLHEWNRGGHSVAVLPCKHDTVTGWSYLLKYEITQSWSPEHELSAVTGGCDLSSGIIDIRADAVRELREETGYKRRRHHLVYLGTCRGAKSVSTLYHLFSADVGHIKPGPMTGDGSRDESLSPTVWIHEQQVLRIADPLVSVLHIRHQFRKRLLSSDLLESVPYPA
jgi:8-oxo-dGTP pyrophosphatase MutT (NUDIX family)